jgi:predicted transcriptional regulator
VNLKEVTVQTRVAKAGMTVREVFEECTRMHVPGLPVCDDHDQVTGRVTLKHILKRFCLPDYLVEMAAILGEQISHVQDMDMMANQLLDDQIDTYIQIPHASTTSASSAVKALALMEKIDTSYLFVIDEGKYQGVVTLQNLSKAIPHLDN